MTTAKLCRAQAATAKRHTKVGDMCYELGATRPTPYRFVGRQGGVASRRHKDAQAQGPERQLIRKYRTNN